MREAWQSEFTGRSSLHGRIVTVLSHFLESGSLGGAFLEGRHDEGRRRLILTKYKDKGAHESREHVF